MKAALVASVLSFSVLAQEVPGPPSNPEHPGSKVYTHEVERKDVRCDGRDVVVAYPRELAGQALPLVIYGHGQALGYEHYEQTLFHLAGKGTITIHPQYDKGFFDQDWIRMGRDFVTLAQCAVNKLGLVVAENEVVFTGHSKGAYVASVAAGLATVEGLALRPHSVLLFQAAGVEESSWKKLPRDTRVTVIHADQDTIVDLAITEKLYALAPVDQKQMIVVKSYGTRLEAKHFWPLTKKSLFGGTGENAFHYYGAWKWLTAAVWDLHDGNRATNTYLYGDLAANKGVEGLEDKIERSW